MPKKSGWLARMGATLMAVLFLFGGVALAEGLALDNSGFEALSSNGLPEGWTTDMWERAEGYSYFEASTDAYEGQYAFRILNEEANDARLEQRVAVEPNTYYHFSAYVKVENASRDGAGANISVKECAGVEGSVYDTAGEWKQIEFYGKTGAGQKEITVCARIGGYGRVSSGSALFDAISVEKVDAVPVGYRVLELDSMLNTASNNNNSSEVVADETPNVWLPFAVGSLLFVVAYLAALSFFPAIDKRRAMILLWIGLAAAVILRLIMAYKTPGHEVDINCWRAWAARMAQTGPVGFFADDYFCDYPPGYLYVLWLAGGLRALFGFAYDSVAYGVLLRIAPIVFDALCAAFIYKIAARHMQQRWALVVALLAAFSPAWMVNSAAWGQIDSVLVLGLLFTLDAAIAKKWLRALPFFALTALVKPQALMLAPLGLAVLVKDLMYDEQKQILRVDALKGLGIGLGLFAALVLPFAIRMPWYWIFEKYGSTLASYPYATVNAYNFFQLFGGNWADLNTAFGGLTYGIYGTIGLSLSVGFAVYIQWMSKDRDVLWLSAAVTLVGAFVFGAKMHERYIFPALALLLIGFVRLRDKRLLWAYFLFTITLFANLMPTLAFIHLQSGDQLLNFAFSLINVIGCVALVVVACRIALQGESLPHALLQGQEAAEEAGVQKREGWFSRELKNPTDHRLRLRGRDFAIMAVMTIAYGAVAFYQLGDMSAPQDVFAATKRDQTVTFDLGQVQDIRRIYYYGEVSQGFFAIELSDDGENWTYVGLAAQPTNTMFRWHVYDPFTGTGPGADSSQITVRDQHLQNLEAEYGPAVSRSEARYVRFRFMLPGLKLMEVGFSDISGETMYDVQNVWTTGAREGAEDTAYLLVNEQETIPAVPSYLNGTYFDEIYHARTAYEHIHEMVPYETTHPPLGKLIIGIGIEIFGMTPFGWRVSGTLLGVLMVPLMYLMAKQLTGKTWLAALAAGLMSVDFMHFTQTRIATIDTYGVFFIMLMFFFMFRYARMSFYRTPLWRTLVVLLLCGISSGLAIASKWIGFYAMVGLAVILFYTLIQRFAEHRAALKMAPLEDAAEEAVMERARSKYWRYTLITLALCVVIFIIIPLAIYVLSYIPYFKPTNNFSLKSVWEAGQSMLRYHAGLGGDTHYFRSPWWEWPLVIRPMWYFSGDYLPAGMVSSISAMGNPLVWWGGLLAMGWVIVRTLMHGGFKDARMRLVIIGFAAQFLPWVLVPRSTFIYHYFASVPFIILAIALFFEHDIKKNPKNRAWLAVYVVGAVALFALFYPLISGYIAPRAFVQWLNWFPTWYLYSGATMPFAHWFTVG